MRTSFSLPFRHRAFGFFILLVLAIATLGGMIWRNLHHFDKVLSHVNYSHSVQSVSIELQQALIEYISESTLSNVPEVPAKTISALDKTLLDMDGLKAEGVFLSSDTQSSLNLVRQFLQNQAQFNKNEKNQRLIEALKVMSIALDYEILEREKLLSTISKDTENELYLASLIFIIILIAAIWFLYLRILHPLNDLKRLLERLTEENYQPFATDHLDPLVLPVFNSYNDMVRHLAELEESNRLHAQSLQREVRIATHALIEQQKSLARAERLSAVGEVAAEFAHEIRNPLAGIQMAFNNLRKEIGDTVQSERLKLINSELKRLAKLVNTMLDQSRHAPEAISHFEFGNLLDELITLLRYQIPENILLEVQIDRPLWLKLPESALRQALLNLFLNAAEILEQKSGKIILRTEKTRNEFWIFVEDNGPGFPDDMLQFGVRPFRTGRQKGTGLGLAMVQRFIRSLGGSIKLSNLSPHGACVCLAIPKNCILGDID